MSWLLDTLQDAAQSFAKAVTGHIKLMQDGPPGTDIVPPPTFTLPTTPAPPANVLPGALKRVFVFIANLKTRAGYDDSIGQDLGIIGTEITPNPDAVPDGKATAKSGEVLIRVKKERHTGVFISGQVATETTWTDVGIATTATYHDTRPLKVAAQPEKRRYRFCFWDGTPTNVWSPVIEVVYGG